jgi:hypothetical protein
MSSTGGVEEVVAVAENDVGIEVKDVSEEEQSHRKDSLAKLEEDEN